MVIDIEPTPENIRQMRTELGWTQARASKEIGGGATAFQKYESGRTKPSKAAFRLLCMRYEKNLARLSSVPEAIQLSSADINELGRKQNRNLSDLLERLLKKEIFQGGLPENSLRLREPENTADGGIDHGISVPAEFSRPHVLPARDVAFQVKAGNMGPKKCAEELMKNNQLKPQIKQVLDVKGAYMIFCSQQVGYQGIKKRLDEMREKLRTAAPMLDNEASTRLHFMDAQQIANWANQYADICEWAHSILGHSVSNCFTSLQQLAGRHEHSGRYCADVRTTKFARELEENLAHPQAIVRVTGLSGVGKTRLLLETLSSNPRYQNTLYVNLAEPNNECEVFKQTEKICRNQPQALIVIDNCSTARIRGFAALVMHASSSSRMIVVDDENGKEISGIATIKVERADEKLIGRILQERLELPKSFRINEYVKAAEGFPGMVPFIVNAHSDELVEPGSIVDIDACYRILGGAQGCSPELKIVARLLSLVTSISDEEGEAERNILASLHESINLDQLNENISRLKKGGLLRTAGNRSALIPPPLAWTLAENQWKIWPEQKLAELYTDKRIKENFLEQAIKKYGHLRMVGTQRSDWLSSLDEKNPNAAPDTARIVSFELAADFKSRLLRRFAEIFGPDRGKSADSKAIKQVELLLDAIASDDKFDGLFDGWYNQWRFEFFAGFVPKQLIAKVHARVQASPTEFVRHLAQSDSWHSILIKVARNKSDCFQPAAQLLFDLAIVETSYKDDGITDYAQNAFVELFDQNSIRQTRLLDELLEKCTDVRGATVIAAALGAPFNYSFASLRDVAEDDVHRQLRKHCISRLVNMATSRKEIIAAPARQQFAKQLRGMLYCHPINEVVESIKKIAGSGISRYWPEAIREINDALRYDWNDDAEIRRQLEPLLEQILPGTVSEKIDFYVTRQFFVGTKPENGDNWETEADQQLKQITDEIAPRWHEYQDLLAGLISAPQTRGSELVYRLCMQVDDDRQLVEYLLAIDRPADHSFLGGILKAMSEKRPGEVDGLLAKLAAKRGLHQHFGSVLRFCGRIDGSRLNMLADCIVASPGPMLKGSLPTSQSLRDISEQDAANFMQRILAGVPAEFAVDFCTEFLHSFIIGKGNVQLEPLAAAFHALIARLTPEFWNLRGQQDNLHDLEQMVLLFASRDNRISRPTASETARVFARVLIANLEDKDTRYSFYNDWFFRSVLVKLLEDFPDALWPLLGDCICRASRAVMRSLLTFFSRRPLLQQLPEEMLISWCDRSSHAREFVFGALPLLQTDENGNPVPKLKPFMLRLVERYDNTPDVYYYLDPSRLRELLVGGTLVDHFRKFSGLLRKLANNSELPPNFRRRAEQEASEATRCAEEITRQDEQEAIDHWNLR